MLYYKIPVMDALKDAGYSAYRLRSENLLGQSTLTKIRAGIVVGSIHLDALCRLLQCQPGDLIGYTNDPEK